MDRIKKDINNNLDTIKEIQYKILEKISKYSKYIDIKKCLQLNVKDCIINPFEIVKDLNIENEINESNMEQPYFLYIVNIYFCYDEYINYLEKINHKINDLKIEELLKANKVKNKLIELLKLNVQEQKKENDEYKIIWNILKKKTLIIKDDLFLNNEIIKYVSSQSEENYLEDLKQLMKSKKISTINMEQKDP